MTTTPAGNEPHRPGGPLAPTAPGNLPLTRPQKILTGIVVSAVLVIAALGFIGSYSAVTDLALTKGFGQFAHAFPLAVDAGIIAFLALDLLLTWRRIPYPLLRYTAWGLTAATIAFNAVVAWPDPIGSSMHGVIPVLFVIAVEAARHAIGRIAEIVADKHIEGPNTSRWFLNPLGTFILWRRQRLWGIRTWDAVLELERERRIYVAGLRKEHGRWGWRRKATADQILVLSLAKDGMSVAEAIELPAREKEKRRQEADRIARQAQQAEDERRREQQAYEQEQQRLAKEDARKAEAERIENERNALALQKEKEDAERQRQIADAEHQARLEEITRQQQTAAQEDEHRRQQEALTHAKAVAAEQERAAHAARQRRENEEAARLEAERKLAAEQRAAEVRTVLANQKTTKPEPRTGNQTNREPRTGATGTGTPAGTANPEPSRNRTETRTANPANLNDRAAAKQNQVIAVLELIDELGFDATTLGVVQERTRMSKTTAYHRLTEARAVWNQRQAS